MNKKKTAITIIASILLMIFVSCSDINPFFAGGVVPGGNWIYFVEAQSVRRVRLDSSEIENVFNISYNNTKKIQLDPYRQKIYILNRLTLSINDIYEYNLDGTGEKKIISTGTVDIMDMTIDPANGYLYYILPSGVKDYNLETSQVEDICNVGLANHSYVVPDYKGGVYYLDDTAFYKVDSLTSSTFVATLTALSNGIYYDRLKDDIYYYETGSIYKVNSGDNFFTSTSLSGFLVLKATESEIFFLGETAAPIAYSIFSVNIDGSEQKAIYTNNFGIIAFDILSK